jgi:hypothetical protein
MKARSALRASLFPTHSEHGEAARTLRFGAVSAGIWFIAALLHRCPARAARRRLDLRQIVESATRVMMHQDEQDLARTVRRPPVNVDLV